MIQPISTASEWVPGQRYEFVFDVRERIPLPNLAVNVRVDQAIRKIAADRRLKLESYRFDPASSLLTMRVLAVSHASLIAVVIGGIIAIAVLVALTFALRSAGQIVGQLSPSPEELAKLDPVTRFLTAAKGFAVPVGIVAIGILFLIPALRR